MHRSLEDLRRSVQADARAPGRAPRSEVTLRWLIHVRWTAIAAQLAVVLVAHLGLGVRLPLAALLGVIGLEAATNVALLVLFRSARRRFGEAPGPAPSRGSIVLGPTSTGRLRRLVLAITVFDTAAFVALLALSGGAGNPFGAFIVVHLAMAAVLLPTRDALVAAVCAIGGLVVIAVFEPHLPDVEHGGALQSFGAVVAFSGTALVTVLVVSRVAAALVARSEELQEERARRERRRHLEALGTLAAGAAHELGTPLSTIAVVAKELGLRLTRAGAAPADVEDAALVRAEVARCRRIIGRMSTDAGGGAGEALVPTDLEALAATITGELAEPGRVRVHIADAGGAPLELPLDGLSTALRALVQNGLDASPPEGAVELRLARSAVALGVDVVDAGHGMCPSDLEHALEPFFTTKAVGSGMGLGLYLAHSYVESLGGTLRIASEEGAGTTVGVRVPLAPTVAGAVGPRG